MGEFRGETYPIWLFAPEPAYCYSGGILTYRRGWVVLLIFTIVIINYMDRIALSVASRPIATEFGFSPIQMGYLFSAFLWTYVLCLIPFGFLSETVGAKRMVGSGIAIWSAATAATAATAGFASILSARLVMGASEATTFPACGRVIRDWFPEKERGMVTTLFNGGSSAGPAIGAVAVAALVSSFGWRIAFAVLGAIGFVWLAVWQAWYGQPEQVAWLAVAEKDKIVAERNGDSEVNHRGCSSVFSSLSFVSEKRMGSCHHSGMSCLHGLSISDLASDVFTVDS